jgi:MFS transporter, FHS family, Na+ dependent glucose transporter 1
MSPTAPEERVGCGGRQAAPGHSYHAVVTSLATPALGTPTRRAADPLRLYLAVFVALGVTASVLGPAVSDLREQVGVGLSAISILFVTQSLGYIGGSLLAGRGYDRRLGHRLLAGAVVAMGLSLLAVTAAPSLAVLAVVFAVVGASAGATDVGGNTLLVWSRGASVGPAMNALHLCFGIGALLAPLLVHGSVTVAGVAVLLAGGLVATALLRIDAPPKLVAADHDTGQEAPKPLVAAVAVFFLLYVGLEAGFGGWVHTYAEEAGLGGPWVATGLTAAFWASFTLGRLVSVGLARRLEPGVMVVGSCVLAVVAAAALVLAGGNPVAVWAATIALGFALAPQFAGMIAYAERHMALSGSATSWFLAASALGSLSVLFLIGQLLDEIGAGALPVVTLVASVATLAWVGVLTRLLAGRRGPAAPGLADRPAT